jgi:lipoprotein Spr
MKEIKILVILMFTLNINSMAQNQFSDYVIHLKNDTTNLKLKRLESFVMEWYGIRYKFGGSTKNGIDCSQYTKKLYWEVYGKKLGNNCTEQWKQTTRIKKDSLMVGDIVFFMSKESPSGWHCGLYLGKDMFSHAANIKEGVKISSLSEPRYLRSYKGAGRFN